MKRKRLVPDPTVRADPNKAPHDLDILNMLYTARFLTTSQLADLFYKGVVKTANNRLRKIFDTKLLGKLDLEIKVVPQDIYILGTNGVPYLADKQGIPEDDVRNARRAAMRIQPLMLPHHLQVNDFRIAVLLACQRRGYQMLFWKYDRDLKEQKFGGEYNDRVKDPMTGKWLPITPDGTFAIKRPEGSIFRFVEIERTCDIQKFKRKVKAYTVYALGDFQERWDYKTFKVLTITPDGNRRDRLRKATDEVLKQKAFLDLFLFTTEDYVKPETVLTPVWKKPNQDNSINIFDKMISGRSS